LSRSFRAKATRIKRVGQIFRQTHVSPIQDRKTLRPE
jgi:hypothetical protein